MGKWAKGQSGNPNGRALEAALRKKLNAPARDDQGNEILEEDQSGKRRQVKNLDLVAAELVRKAKKGDINAIQECFNRIDGRVKQEHDVTTAGQPLTFQSEALSDFASFLAGSIGGEADREASDVGADGSVLPDQVRSGETRH